MVALALSAAFALDSWGQSQEPSPEIKTEQQPARPQPEQTTEADEKNAPPSSSAIPEVLRESSDRKCDGKCSDTEQGGTEFWPPFRGYRLKVTDTLVAAFTALLFFATIALWWSTRRLVKGAERTAERQLRAYIVANAGEVQRIEEGFLLSATLKNTGQTPAFNVRVMGETFGEIYPLATEHPHPAPREDFGVPLGSGEEIHCAYRIFVDPDDALRRVQSGEVGLWIQGTIIYDDCFKVSRTTKFRFVYGGRIAAATVHMHADREGNTAD